MSDDILSVDVPCHECGAVTHVPVFRDLKAKAIEDWDLAEVSAQKRLSGIWVWLHDVSLFGLILWWFRGRKLR